jgi:cyclopropane fatty-acyl-phospholipid synthase-like methyltransferase
MSENKEGAKEFFNSISDTYKSKYSTKSAFHHYFFHERLDKATAGLKLKENTILDVGAGTGDLYDHLLTLDKTFNYFATDVAEGMLKHSNISSSNYAVGVVTQLNLPYEKFDKIFMLGVSTYLTVEEMRDHAQFFHKSIEDDGQLIITFTNKICIDGLNRWILRPFIKLVSPKNNVLSGDFKIRRYKLKEVKELFEKNGWEIDQVDWLNHTIFPYNLILKKPSVWLAKQIDKIKSGWFISLFSSDFIIRASKKN